MRWRYRDEVSPIMAAGARVLADVVPAHGIDPAAALHTLAGPGSVLLESGEGRWSYLAPWPAAVLSRRDPAGGLEEARVLLDRLAAEVPAGAPPFTGGLLGSLGYDLARALEAIPQLARDDLALPALQLAAVDSLYAFDRERDELWVVARAERELQRLREGLARVRPAARPAAPGDELRGMPYAHYRARVERVLDHIGRGDVYEVNYTQRLEGNCSSALDLYARLRESAPVPYNLYLDAGGWQLVGASPETFLRVSADGRCETRPIKGTRPRDDDPIADAALAADLATHPKDRAENVMIVDLARNDLSRVCLPGTVRVPSLCVVESHPTVHQLVSTVTGQLGPGLDALDVVAAAFAPGSMTGAPKVRAMQLIEQLEPVRRGPYAGAFGWLAPDGSCDLAVVIRTAVVTRGRAYLHVGGAIVADSDPAAEYEESLVKARTVARALGAVVRR
jgi:para-aminobenzoate synthetase component 1